MRAIAIGIAVAAMIAYTAVGPSAAAELHAGTTAGCLRVPITTCVAALRASMIMDGNYLVGTLATRQHVDVNGRRLGGTINVSGLLPNQMEPVTMLLSVGPDDRVTQIEASLLGNPLTALTEQGFRDTGLYDVVVRSLGNRCSELSPPNLYRFFENTVKPRVTVTQQDSGGIFSSHEQIFRAERIPYCGVSFTFFQRRTFSGPQDPNFASNIRDFWSIRLE